MTPGTLVLTWVSIALEPIGPVAFSGADPGTSGAPSSLVELEGTSGALSHAPAARNSATSTHFTTFLVIPTPLQQSSSPDFFHGLRPTGEQPAASHLDDQCRSVSCRAISQDTRVGRAGRRPGGRSAGIRFQRSCLGSSRPS